MGRSGRTSEGREVTGERSLVYILAQDERGFNPTQLFHNPQRDTHSATCIQIAHRNTCRQTHNRGSKVSFTVLDLPVFSRNTSASTLARLCQSLNEKLRRMGLTADERRKDRGGGKPVCLLPAEHTKSKCERL